MVDVIAAGQICLDLLPDMGSVPLYSLASPGKLFEIDGIDLSVGGGAGNTGLALHQLGIDVALMGCVGDDLIAETTLKILQAQDASLTRFVKVRAKAAGSYSLLLSPESQDRIILYFTGPNATFGHSDIDFEAVQAARIFHLGYPPLLPRLYQNNGEELVEIFKQVKATGVITSLDLALPAPNSPAGQVDWKSILMRTLPYVDIFLPSIEEIVLMMKPADYESWHGDVMPHITNSYLDKLSEELLTLGAAVVGFKLGEYGFYVRSTADKSRLPGQLIDWHNQQAYHPAFEVDVTETTGAGDSAYAGFLAAMLHGLSLPECVRVACAAGACSVEAAGASAGILPWPDTLSRLQGGWPLNTVRLAGT